MFGAILFALFSLLAWAVWFVMIFVLPFILALVILYIACVVTKIFIKATVAAVKLGANTIAHGVSTAFSLITVFFNESIRDEVIQYELPQEGHRTFMFNMFPARRDLASFAAGEELEQDGLFKRFCKLFSSNADNDKAMINGVAHDAHEYDQPRRSFFQLPSFEVSFFNDCDSDVDGVIGIEPHQEVIELTQLPDDPIIYNRENRRRSRRIHELHAKFGAPKYTY